MTDLFNLIARIRSAPCVSGYEELCGKNELIEALPDADRWQEDGNGNLFCLKKGRNQSKTLLIEAHRDTIGLCIKKHLKDSFYSVSACGGFDLSILPGTRLIIITSDGTAVPALAASKPPHVLTEEDKKKKAAIEDIYVDTGIFNPTVLIGDPICFAESAERLANDHIVSPGLDNAVGVACSLAAFELLEEPAVNVLFLLSSSEETLSRGVASFPKDIKVDGAIILDAGFHLERGLDETKCIIMGKGPSVSVTDTLSPAMTQWVEETAIKHGLPLQIICEPGGTGTSATHVQLRNGGIPCAVISIPISNMHTPSEIVNINDLEDTVKLLCALCRDGLLPEKEVSFNEC